MKTLFTLALLAVALAATAAPAVLQPVKRVNPTPTLRAAPAAEPANESAASPAFKIDSPSLRAPNTTKHGETEIISKSAYFDLKTRTAVYLGDVKVRDPRMELACERLTIKVGDQSGGKFESIVAESNVVIDVLDGGQPCRCTGGRATYTYARDVMELTENPAMTSGINSCRGDVITYDRVTKNIRVTNPRTVFTSPSDSSTPR
jgi:lipopolysaccharide transport protein LptA